MYFRTLLTDGVSNNLVTLKKCHKFLCGKLGVVAFKSANVGVLKTACKLDAPRSCV